MFFAKKLGMCFGYQCKTNTSLCVNDLEKEARQKLPNAVFDFFAGGSGEEITLKENMLQFDRIKLMPRVLKEITSCEVSSKILGQEFSFPLLIAPMAFQKLAHELGEIAVAKAASEHDILMTVSTLSTTTFADIKSVSTSPPWLQIYIYKDREITKNLIKSASDLGYKAIMLTVDVPFYSKRPRELKTPIEIPSSLYMVNLINAGLELKNISPSLIPQYLASLLSSNISWKDIDWLRSITSLPIILKGILHPEDIQIAIENSIEGVILSNHGGRQLDTAITSLESLQLVKDDLKEKIEIIVDGGVRKGIDILKALALGAKGVMIGRPIIWGLAVNGEKGVSAVINNLKEELILAMALTGCSSIKDINENILLQKYI
jgi:isopentenyl diphosphate isomerase/L-lactate dehydrogenase-like FMN-dependent dehydrogenase